jgi:hypothetical protein
MTKKFIKGIIVAIVLVGMLALYLLPALGPITQPVPSNPVTGFTGPTSDPYVKGPTAPPTAADAGPTP